MCFALEKKSLPQCNICMYFSRIWWSLQNYNDLKLGEMCFGSNVKNQIFLYFFEWRRSEGTTEVIKKIPTIYLILFHFALSSTFSLLWQK